MIQSLFNGMITLMLAKFVLNDVPHFLYSETTHRTVRIVPPISPQYKGRSLGESLPLSSFTEEEIRDIEDIAKYLKDFYAKWKGREYSHDEILQQAREEFLRRRRVRGKSSASHSTPHPEDAINNLIEQVVQNRAKKQTLYREFARTPGSETASEEALSELQGSASRLDVEYYDLVKQILDLSSRLEVGSPELAEVERKLRYLGQ